MRKFTFLFTLLILFFACKNDKKTSAKPDVVASHIDSTAMANIDFFQFAEGGWMKKNPIPESESRWGIGNLVNEDIYQKKLKINEDAAKISTSAGSNLQKIGDFWKTGMDTSAIEKAGITPLKIYLDRIDAIKNTIEIINEVADYQAIGVGAMFGIYVSQDMKNSDKIAVYLNQGGIGLPNRDYYFDTDSRTSEIRSKYAPHVQKMLTLAGDAQTAATRSTDIMKLETSMAKFSRKLEDLRDPNRNYNKMSIAQLQKLTPSIDWKNFFSKISKENIDSVIVGQPEFFTNLEKLIKTTPLETWKSYLRWNIINGNASNLSSDFVNQHFDFYGKTISGKKQLKPRWKRVLDKEEELLGDALGELFVKEYFPPKTKKRYDDMVDNVLGTFRERLNNLTWMTPETKVKALAKLATVKKKVGYPDKFKDFSAMQINNTSYCQNIWNANKWWINYSFSKLNKPVNRDEWEMTPQTYNAYYNPSNNEIVLPAAQFLIPGYADDEVDDAVVYGYAAASTIGHEITHGFDDEGRQFDEKGNLVSWWTKKDEEEFNKRAQVMVQQFDDFVVLDSLHLNGKASLGENIADYGGVVIGFEAFKKTEAYKKGEKIAGLTQEQRFFLGYSLGWQSHIRPEQLANQVKTDVHAPAKQRVIGPFSNFEPFYKAFNVKENDPMWRPLAKRVDIW